MSDFLDLIGQGFALILKEVGTPITAAANGATASCILSPFIRTQELRDSGYFAGVTATAELTRAAFIELALANLSVVTVDGKTMKVATIEDDPADACIRVHLRPER